MLLQPRPSSRATTPSTCHLREERDRFPEARSGGKPTLFAQPPLPYDATPAPHIH
jgi:hypothetical protein